MKQDRLKIVVLGIMGRTPFAGVAWQALHYLEGFRLLGHDVYYVEDSGDWCLDLDRGTISDDCTYVLRYLARAMEWMGLGEQWAFRAASQENRVFGLSESRLQQVLSEADLLINLCGSTFLKEEHLQVPCRAYLETDPGAPQIHAANGHGPTLELLQPHTHHFTYAENIEGEDCLLPKGPFQYHTTRQPIVLEWWQNGDEADDPAVPGWARDCFTTVASWKQKGRDIEWQGENYTWSKHHRFLEFLDLPAHTTQPLGMALSSNDPQVWENLRKEGWRLTDAVTLTKDILPYRSFIRHSRGEFTVAKDQYARTRSGWFSDRSASYLAAARPVITEDTRFDAVIPTGRGLFAFKSEEDILHALEELNSDYEGHSRAARELADEYFRAEKVLKLFIEDLQTVPEPDSVT